MIAGWCFCVDLLVTRAAHRSHALATAPSFEPRKAHTAADDRRWLLVKATLDLLKKLGQTSALIRPDQPDTLIAPVQTSEATQIATACLTCGWVRDWVMAARRQMTAVGLTLTEWRRKRDAMIWPDRKAGFFKVKKNVPQYLAASGLLAR